MNHVAIDLGSRESQICIRNDKGEIVREKRLSTQQLQRELEKQPPSRVIVESCAEGFAVAEMAREAGHEVRVVASTLAPSLGVGMRGIKTDTRDARALSEVSTRIDLPSVHIPSRNAREVKQLCSMREALVEVRTKLINTVRGYLRCELIRVPSGSSRSFAQRVRKKLLALPSGLSSYVERQLRAIEALDKEIDEANAELEELSRADKDCELLKSMPGVGPTTALRYLATLDEAERFQSASQVGSYVGLTPGERSSGQRTRRTGITKAGQKKLRWALIQAAWVMRRCRPEDPLVLWSLEIEKRRGKRIATTALARKMAIILWAMLREQKRYDPKRAVSSAYASA